MNKKLLIGLGLVFVAGVGFYFWRKNKNENSDKKSETKNNATGESEVDLVKSNDDYRVQKEIPSVEYFPVNKSYYTN